MTAGYKRIIAGKDLKTYGPLTRMSPFPLRCFERECFPSPIPRPRADEITGGRPDRHFGSVSSSHPQTRCLAP